MLNVCNFLNLGSDESIQFPFFGDISPDSPPSWLLGHPFLNNRNQSSKWSRIWGDFNAFDTLIKHHIHKLNDYSSEKYKKEQWVKIVNTKSQLFCCIKDKRLESHSHLDDGSFYYIIDNMPIIIDPGLKNYLKEDTTSRFQLNANSHSVITINGCGLTPPRTSWMNKTDMKRKVRYKLDSQSLNIYMEGFRCLGRWIIWHRTINNGKSDLSVLDKIDSKKDDIVDIRYVVNPNAIIVNNQPGWTIKLGNYEVDLKITAESTCNKFLAGLHNTTSGLMSKTYGEESTCIILLNSFKAEGPLNIKSDFTMIS